MAIQSNHGYERCISDQPTRSLLRNQERVFQEDEEQLNRYLAELEDRGDEFTSQNLDPQVWMNTFWDRMDPSRREDYLVKLLRHTLERARSQPLYQTSEAFMAQDPDDFERLSDLLKWPVLPKDGPDGFRESVLADPRLMRPTDHSKTGLTIYESGGSGGGATPTYLSATDMEIDAAGHSRAALYGGIEEGDTLLNGYNPAHKGGRIAVRSMELLNGTALPMRPEEDAQAVTQKIHRYGVDALAAVETGEGIDKKSGGKNFFGLLGTDAEAVLGIEKWFVTGYPLIDDLVDFDQTYPMERDDQTRRRLFTSYGTSEAIPLAVSTALYEDSGVARYNAQHLLHGPHHIEVIVEDDGELRPAKAGERGIALLTTIDRRDGTIYVNYALGDAITLEPRDVSQSVFTTPLVSDIQKVDDPVEVLEGGCTVI